MNDVIPKAIEFRNHKIHLSFPTLVFCSCLKVGIFVDLLQMIKWIKIVPNYPKRDLMINV